jgi:ubiquinone/menaquinone biosynthesis C-methylase UbiE
MTAPRHGHYGIDAPRVLYGLAAAALGATAATLIALTAYGAFNAAFAAIAVVFALMTCSYLWTTRRGKFAVWSELLDGLALRGEERVLDVGCGRGAVLLLAAQRLTQGQAVGIDLWSAKDQSGNSEQATLRNAELEGVRDRVTLLTADMRALPFPDCSFDVVTSSLAIHNIVGAAQRERALAEILRVLKPGGTALIADIGRSRAYRRFLALQPGTLVERRALGWRFWCGGPHVATSLVSVMRTSGAD